MAGGNLPYPVIDAVQAVLRRLGIDPVTRVDAFDQDPEYTACRVEELAVYAEFYDTSLPAEQRRVLGCFLLECLEEHLGSAGSPHPLQESIFDLLHQDLPLQADELAYWACRDEPDLEAHWRISSHLRDWALASPGTRTSTGGSSGTNGESA